MDRTSLKNRVALITGASSGIGRAIADRLAGAGCRLGLIARREDRLANFRDSHPDVEVIPLGVDLTDRPAAESAVKRFAHEWDRIDILINAAGVARQARLSDGDPGHWREMLEINVLALATVTRAALPHMPDETGHIVNLSSMSGHRVPGKGGFYAATKFAVRALGEGLRQELRADGRMIRVSNMSPGFVNTELLDIYFENQQDSGYQPLDYPILQPEEIAELVYHQLTLPLTAEVTDILIRPTGQLT